MGGGAWLATGWPRSRRAAGVRGALGDGDVEEGRAHLGPSPFEGDVGGPELLGADLDHAPELPA